MPVDLEATRSPRRLCGQYHRNSFLFEKHSMFLTCLSLHDIS